MCMAIINGDPVAISLAAMAIAMAMAPPPRSMQSRTWEFDKRVLLSGVARLQHGQLVRLLYVCIRSISTIEAVENIGHYSPYFFLLPITVASCTITIQA